MLHAGGDAPGFVDHLGLGDAIEEQVPVRDFLQRPDLGGLLLYSVVVGGFFGCTIGLFTYALSSDGQRDFVSDTSIEADRYEIQADSGVADEAKRLLASMPGRS